MKKQIEFLELEDLTKEELIKLIRELENGLDKLSSEADKIYKNPNQSKMIDLEINILALQFKIKNIIKQ